MRQSGIFDAKLQELQLQYCRMIECLRPYQADGRGGIRRAMKAIWEEYLESEQRLEQSVNGSRSPVAAALSEAQLYYSRSVRQILQENFAQCFGNGSPVEGRLEAVGLYGEYAIDFAVQSVRYALLIALSAIDAQLNDEEEKA